MGWEGRVLLRVEVDAGGRVANVQVVESSGRPILDEAAQRDVQEARFQPGLIDERPAPMSIRLPISYRIVK
jgi:protein TonB